MIDALIRDDLRCFVPYQSARTDKRPAEIYLNANELPWDTDCNRYPEQQPAMLRKQFSQLFAVDEDQLLMTRGSDEAIDLLIRLCCKAAQDSILICPPTYGMYAVYAAIQGANIIDVPRDAQFALQVDAIEQAWQPSVKLLFLCSPNNPTGNCVTINELERLCRLNSIVVVDEAYIEFADTPSITAQLARWENLVVLRTLSKAYGLAGVRCGMVLANAPIIAWLRKILAPYPIPVDSNRTIINTCDVAEKVALIKKERTHVAMALGPLVQSIWPSQGNFILFRTENTQELSDYLQQQGLLLRYFPAIDCLRMTIGTPEQNQRVIQLITAFGALS